MNRGGREGSEKRRRPSMLKISYKEKKEELAARQVVQNMPKEAESSKVVSVGTSSMLVDGEGGKKI